MPLSTTVPTDDLRKISEFLEKQKHQSMISHILIPLVVALIAGSFTSFVTYMTIKSEKPNTSLRMLEVLTLVLEKMSIDYPERNMLLIDIIAKTEGIDDDLVKRFYEFSGTFIQHDIVAANQQGNTESTARLDAIHQALTASDNSVANNLKSELEATKYDVIVASGIDEKSAQTLLERIDASQFPKKKAFGTPSVDWIVTLGEFTYTEATSIKSNYENLSPFDGRKNEAILVSADIYQPPE